MVDLSTEGDQSVRGLSDLYSPDPGPDLHSPVHDIADILQEMGKITEDQYARLRLHQASNPACDSVEWLVQEKCVDADDVLPAKAQWYGLEFQPIAPADVEKEAFEKLSSEFIRRNFILPVRVEGQTLVVATSEPGNVLAMEDVKRQTQMELKVVVCRAEDIEAAC